MLCELEDRKRIIYKQSMRGSLCTLRAFAATVCNPLELIKVRMQSRGNRHKSALRVLRSVVGTDGVLGLWKGTVPSAVGMGSIFS